MHKIICPQSDLVICLLLNRLNFTVISVNTAYFYYQKKKRWHSFCNNNHLSWSSAIHRWLKSIIDSKVLCKFFPAVFIGQLMTTKNQEVKLINITNLFPTAYVMFFSKLDQTLLFGRCILFTCHFFNASYSFSSVTTMPQSWKQASIQLYDKHH